MADAPTRLPIRRPTVHRPPESVPRIVPPPPDAAVLASLDYCHQVTRAKAKNFYYGLKLTPEPRRGAGYAIYAFMRACDDLVDSPLEGVGAKGDVPAEIPVEIGMQRVELFRRQMEGVLAGGPLPPEPFWPAFRHVVRTYSLDPVHLHEMLDGQRADLVKTKYESFDELYDYCYKVASVVGLVCIRLWGAGNVATAQKLAEYRGIAFQLTNILRDVAEDAQRDRVYLPAHELKLFGYDPAGFKSGRRDAAFDAMMRFQIDRARSYYDRSRGLEAYLNPSCRPTSWALMKIYSDLLDKIDAAPHKVLTQRVRLSTLHKLSIAFRAPWRKRRRR